MRGKDYCNCEHARLLSEAIAKAWARCPLGATETAAVLKGALDAEYDAMVEYLEETYGKGEK